MRDEAPARPAATSLVARQLDEAADGVYELQLVDGLAVGVEQARRCAREVATDIEVAAAEIVSYIRGDDEEEEEEDDPDA